MSAASQEKSTKGPLNTALRQQTLGSWKPILDPNWVIAALVVIGVIFVPTGFKLQSMSNDIVEIVKQYDAYDDPDPLCGINNTANAGKKCTIDFVVPKDMEPPILIHYQVDGFYQNQRRYAQSRDDGQLLGATTQSKIAADKCRPLAQLGNTTINPCGLVANTLFNDVFTLSGSSPEGDVPFVMIEQGIAWQSDLEYKFRQPEGFYHEECFCDEEDCSCDGCSCDGPEWSCDELGPYRDQDGKCFRYFYPNDETTQYLYETYPMVVSPIEGVMNEHFVVWMRLAALSKFRKLYGWIDQPVQGGTTLTFEVTANWEVMSFKGSKALVVSHSNDFGGKNDELGQNFIIIGIMCLGFAAVFGLKHQFSRRELADKNYLHFKED